MKLGVVRYGNYEQFEKDLNEQFEAGYTLHSWNITQYGNVAAVFVSLEALIEQTMKITDEATKRVLARTDFTYPEKKTDGCKFHNSEGI